jgi:cold shock CspA family protein
MIGDQILDSFVANFAQEHELGEAKPDQLFEHFANYAVLSRLYNGTVQLDALETDRAFGIDGIAIIANDLLVTSRDEIKEVARHSLDGRFVFVQAKTSPTFDTGDILKFINAVGDFFTDPPKIAPNARIKHLRDLRKAVFAEGIKMVAPPSCELYYVCTGTWTSDQTLSNLLENEKAKLIAQFGFGQVKVIPVDLEKIKGYFRSIKQRVRKQFSFEKRAVLPKVEGVNQAYIGLISAREYLKLITDPDGNLERGLFYENVRDYLGDNPVNREITAAVRNSQQDQDKFVLLNNGVTIVAQSITPIGDDFTLRDYQVVNGCQTSHVLFYNRAFIVDSLHLPLKLIATENQELTNLIIKATNWQTEVKQEAFIALEPFQKRLEEFYGSIPRPDQRLYYERRSKQYEADNTPKSRVVTISTQTTCFVAMYLAEPHSTHRYYGELLNAYWKIKKKIFQDDHDPQPYYYCAYTMFLIDREFREGRLPVAIKRFRYHLLYLVRTFIAPNDDAPVELGAKRTKDFHERLQKLLTDTAQFRDALKRAKHTITEVLDKSGQRYQGEAERRSEFTNAIRSRLAATIETPEPPKKNGRQLRGAEQETVGGRGTIKRMGLEFGFITDEKGQDVFFHRSQWRSSGNIVEGIGVVFTPVLGQKGWRALAVRRAVK